MTTYAAYDAGLPCRNTQCRSYGVPHPNCRCYPNMQEIGDGSRGATGMAQGKNAAVAAAGLTAAAVTVASLASRASSKGSKDEDKTGSYAEGGEVKRFCDYGNMAHHPDCEYFQDGGEVGPQSIDDLIQAFDDEKPAQTEKPQSKQESEPPKNDGPKTIDEMIQSLPKDEVVEPATSYDTGPSLPPAPNINWEQEGLGLVQGAVSGGLPFVGKAALEKSSDLLQLPFSEQQMKEREAQYPGAVMAGEFGAMAAPGSLWGKIGKGVGAVGEALPFANWLSKQAPRVTDVGGRILRSAVESGIFQSSEEFQKWIMGHGDPEDAAAAAMSRTGISSLLGAGLQTLSEVPRATAHIMSAYKWGEKLRSFLYGLGVGAEFKDPIIRQNLYESLDNTVNALKDEGFKLDFPHDVSAIKSGANSYDRAVNPPFKLPAMLYELYAGDFGLLSKALASSFALDLPITRKIVSPLLYKLAESPNIGKVYEAMNHAKDLYYGDQAIKRATRAIFDYTKKTVPRELNVSYEGDRESIENWHPNLNVHTDLYHSQQKPDFHPGLDIQTDLYKTGQKPGFAEGGVVQEHERDKHRGFLETSSGLAAHYPAQNFVMNAAKMRIGNYLNSLKQPEEGPKLAFDKFRQDKKLMETYRRAVDIAMNPLTILNGVKDGNLKREELGHFKAMFPELDTLLHKRLTQHIVEEQMEGRKPPFETRKGLSTFLGVPMSSEFTPSAAQMIQQTFQAKQAQQPQPQGGGKSGGSKAALSKGDQAYLTKGQSLTKRSQNPR